MKQKKILNKSLKNKIEENEEKFHLIFNKYNNRNYKEQYNEDNKENKPYLDNKIISDNFQNMVLTEMNLNKKSISISYVSENNNSTFMRKKFTKRNIIKNQKKYNKNNMEKNKLNLNLNNLSITPSNTKRDNKKIDYSFNYNYINRKNIYDKTNKVLLKDKNNINKYNESYIKDKSVLETFDNTIKKAVNLNHMFERFEVNQQKKKEKIENMIKKKESKEKKQYTYKPRINKKSKNINKHIKDDFITRQKRFSFIKDKKEEKLKEKILKNEQEKINKDNFLLQKKNQDNSSVYSGLNTSFISEISCPTRSMVEISNSISKLFEWDEKRKEKIMKLQKEKSKEINKNKHIPKINKKSKSMAHRNKKENIFERLSKEDEVVKAKKKIMEDLLNPTFRPNINLIYRRFNEEEDNILGNRKINNKRKIFDNKEINIIKDTDLLKKENEKIENDEIYEQFRKIIINNINKEKRNKSFSQKESEK